MESLLPTKHENHTAGKGITPMTHYHLVGPTNVRGSVVKKSGNVSPSTHFSNIQEHLGPSLGFIQGGVPHHRSPNALTFADRDPNFTL